MLTLGLMSGTSADGVDAVLVRWMPDDSPQLLAHVHLGFEPVLRQQLLSLNQPAADELHRAALAANALARVYAQACAAALARAGEAAWAVTALGAHGQTVRHQPGLHDGSGYTLQLLNGALLAELSGIDVVCDLRSRDVAAGGQGAPLVPALHDALFARDDADVAVLNIGGIANLSLLPARQTAEEPRRVRGFDCGPGNALMDLWCETHTGQAFDDAGRWAAGGRVHTALLARLLAEPYLALMPPKSTGRDLFNRHWLDEHLAALGPPLAPQDVQTTLAEYTAQTAVQALRLHAPRALRLVVCGGGARNTHLVQRLQAHLGSVELTDSAALGVPVDQVEALAFAWLARAFVRQQPGNLPAVTGAAGLRRLGCLYPAR